MWLLLAALPVLACGWLLYSRSDRRVVARAEHGSGGERVAAIDQLAGKSAPKYRQTFRKLAADPNPVVASHAILGLVGSNDPVDLQIFHDALHDKRKEVRESAIDGLGALDKAKIQVEAPALIGILDTDEDAGVKGTAAQILGQRRIWTAMPSLIKAMRDPDITIRHRANAAVETILGLKVGYHAEDPPHQREQAIQRTETAFRAWESNDQSGIVPPKPAGK